ncbi:hypothetical protein [Methylobacterium sp.]|uniref:hypothetical protein n=1 Tax=Methylobacterium sp. TaxID=409 RepID=UPI0025D4220A|nr:hypothetical protein [Methylobacterium sp.]MBY0257608.1 hypothetical protein [Methylobacterium sp.]
MSAAPAPSHRSRDAARRLPELSYLAGRLADRVVEAQVAGEPVPDDHIRFLLDAALLLQEHGVGLPSLLGQIMRGAAEPEIRMPRVDEDDDAGRLAWLLRPFQETRG